jgi:Tfp pilus assembly protein PilF
MKKLFFLMMFLSVGILIYSQPVKGKLMSVTTSSKSALSLYNEAMKYFDEVSLDKALGTFIKALDQDPEFFMANYQMAFYYLLNRAPDDFDKYADAAINCKTKLSDGEEPNSYNNLVYFQSLAGDSTNMVETLKQAIKIADNPAPFYNQLGYAYLTLKQSDKALEAFDKYIELEPENPNVYDSKGDYFIYIRKFDKAYESYMKAYSMNPSFSKDKAEMARQLYEQTEGKKLEIISM